MRAPSGPGLLVLFAFYAIGLELATGRGFVGAVASPPGMVLLVGAGALLAVAAVRSGRAPAPPALIRGRRGGR